MVTIQRNEFWSFLDFDNIFMSISNLPANVRMLLTILLAALLLAVLVNVAFFIGVTLEEKVKNIKLNEITVFLKSFLPLIYINLIIFIVFFTIRIFTMSSSEKEDSKMPTNDPDEYIEVIV